MFTIYIGDRADINKIISVWAVSKSVKELRISWLFVQDYYNKINHKFYL